MGHRQPQFHGPQFVPVREEDADAAAVLVLEDAGRGAEPLGHEAHPGQTQAVELVGQDAVVHVGGAQHLEGRRRPAADAHGRFQEAHAGVERRGVQIAHVGRGVRPGQARGVEPQAAPPALGPDHLDLGAGLEFRPEHQRQLAHGHAVADGHGMAGGEPGLGGHHRAFHQVAPHRVDPVQHDQPHPGVRGGLEAALQGGDVGVEPAADVLHVEDQRVQARQVPGRRGALAVPVEADDGKARAGVHGIRDALLVQLAADAVLGAEQALQAHPRRALEDVGGGPAPVVDARGVGDQADAQALQGGEARALQHVDPVEHGGHLALLPGEEGAFGAPGDARGAGRQRAHLVVQLAGHALAVRVQARGEQHEEGVRGRIHPQGRARPARVPVGAQPEEVAPGLAVGGVQVPAQAPALEHRGRRLDAAHHRQGSGPEDGPAVEEEARVLRQVGSGGEEPGVAGHAAHAPRGGVVHHAPQHDAVLVALGGGHVGGVRVEGRMGHAQGPEDLPGREGVQSLPRHAADDLAQEDEVHVAVTELQARRRIRSAGAGAADAFSVAAPGIRERHVGDQPGGVGEQVAHGHIRRGEFGEVVAHRRVQAHLAALHQHHDAGKRGHHLGQRGHVEDGPLGHGLHRGPQGPVALRPVRAPRAGAHPQHRPGGHVARDGSVQGGPELREPLGVERLRVQHECGKHDEHDSHAPA